MGIIEMEEEVGTATADICATIKSNIPSTPRTQLTRYDIARRCNLQVPEEFKTQYLDILFKHQEAISINKYDLGLAKNYKHQIHLKNENPVYRKQFKIPEAHHNFMVGRMAQVRSSPVVGLTLQLTDFLRAKKARTRTPDHTGFQRA
jgi:hypothetical protein